VDTGATLQALLEHVRARVATASLTVAVLLEKRIVPSVDAPGEFLPAYNADYVGFSIPNKFVVGYGMDYNQIYRDLPHIAVINRVGISRFGV
jgi:hypoxanthine phosphoribosyltransferase